MNSPGHFRAADVHMVESILNKDVTMVQGLALIIGIMVTVLAINLLGDGLRDALDPHMKR